jgi:phospholipase A1
MSRYFTLLFIFFVCSNVLAQEPDLSGAVPLSEKDKLVLKKAKQCIEAIKNAGLSTINFKHAKRYCEVKAWAEVENPGRYAKRIINEKATELNPFVITPHKLSYILPVTYSDNFNSSAYTFIDEATDMPYTENLSNVEAKYQISLKVPLLENDLLIRGDMLYFGMTLQAWWQLYSDEISKPFRETNYQPEIFYVAPISLDIERGNLGFMLSFEHQSNGQSQYLSRSWNRIIAGVLFEKDDFMVAFKPWYRVPESDKTTPLQPLGDDNPDIEDYMGNYEIQGAYAFNDEKKLSFMIRKNWRTGNGAIELNFTQPLWGRFVGLIHYFNGYGESLIDYNHKQQKIGFGIALTEIF